MSNKHLHTTNFRLIVFVSAVTAIGGFLFGYDTAVISGAIGFLKTHFALSDVQMGWAGGSAIIGCIPGALIAGFLTDRYGRKRILILCALLFAISGIFSAIPRTFTEFILARFLGGLGIGISSIVCPLYIAEIAPDKYRGRLGALFQLGIVIGIFLVFFINLLIQRTGDSAWNVDIGWRWMLGSEIIPALLFFLLLFLVPESPRWLTIQGLEGKAKAIFTRFYGRDAATQQLAKIKTATMQGEGRFRELFRHPYLRPLLIAIPLAIFAQFSGINAIMYYAPEIFKTASTSTDTAFMSTVWVGAINLLFTFVAIVFVDRAGRRPLLLIGTAIQTLSLFCVGWMFYVGHQGLGVLLFILTFVAAFAMAMGPLPWIIISEIFPARLRGRAASLGIMTIWIACYIVAQTFPMLNARLGGGTTFLIYGICSLASFIFAYFVVPETKGRSLEEIQTGWERRSNSRRLQQVQQELSGA
jgi:MFS transporter, SP family, arabinose:H+ symporter